MARVRIYELARELGVESKDVLAEARELGLEVKTASSSVDEAEADLIRLAFGGSDETEAAEETTETVEAAEETTEVGEAPQEAEEVASEDVVLVSVPRGSTVAEFAEALGVAPSRVVGELVKRGRAAGVGDPMPEDLVDEVAEVFGAIVELEEPVTEAAPAVAPMPEFADEEKDLKPRSPVVTVMGHVDHGKTTLLDYIRKTRVVDTEEGGITQRIGAYQVEVGGNKLTFIDTPGHEAFTAMRARGAEVTDIVVLVVAADDGVMPQTVEAIDHAKAAGVQLVVAINKIDVPGADPMKVRTQLTEHGVITEELGGDVPSVEVSAVTGQGVDQLLEIIDLIAQLQEYKANPDAPAVGVVIESQLDPRMGPTATVIVKRGTLRQGDSFVAGAVSGRVRAMMDDQGRRLREAGPSTPVLIMGWSDVPTAGDILEVVENDKEARRIAAERAEAIKAEEHRMPTARERLQMLLEQLRSEQTELPVIVKADTHGSLEALRESIAKIKREDARINIVHGAVGGITENDVMLADVTGAVIVGFNVRPEGKARRAAEEKGIEIRTYRIIYELLEELEQLLVGRLEPEKEEIVLGSAEVRATFRVPRVGTVAGCYVTEGVVQRGARARLLRGGVVVYDGRIGSLKRFKDDVREVASGFECGVGLEDFNDVKEGDVIEVYEVREVART
ncbi:MAG: hypothetical protein KatS3mg011_1345 [Acidimicrobiia bacterium]|jgi:translation initiation factor IF-2|nr:MAG: hypothetical protein KatS3mg011_1345 [Acidimicrobiia bacterium]